MTLLGSGVLYLKGGPANQSIGQEVQGTTVSGGHPFSRDVTDSLPSKLPLAGTKFTDFYGFTQQTPPPIPGSCITLLHVGTGEIRCVWSEGTPSGYTVNYTVEVSIDGGGWTQSTNYTEASGTKQHAWIVGCVEDRTVQSRVRAHNAYVPSPDGSNWFYSNTYTFGPCI